MTPARGNSSDRRAAGPNGMRRGGGPDGTVRIRNTCPPGRSETKSRPSVSGFGCPARWRSARPSPLRSKIATPLFSWSSSGRRLPTGLNDTLCIVPISWYHTAKVAVAALAGSWWNCTRTSPWFFGTIPQGETEVVVETDVGGPELHPDQPLSRMLITDDCPGYLL